MRPDEVTDDWLVAANKRYRASGIAPAQRPMQAISDLCGELNCSIVFGSPAEKKISDWFRENTKPKVHSVGSLFTGSFFFDACFWQVQIPVGYGTISLNPLDALKEMPPSVKRDLEASIDDLKLYLLYWADCADYGYGIGELRHLNDRARAFIANGNAELMGCISQLNAARPNSKAILAARLVCEIFPKALLIQEKGYRNKELINIGHDLEKLAREASQAISLPAFQLLERRFHLFPKVSDRYDGSEKLLSQVWEALSVAQATASAVVRHYSSRDTRSQIAGSKLFN